MKLLQDNQLTLLSEKTQSIIGEFQSLVSVLVQLESQVKMHEQEATRLEEKSKESFAQEQRLKDRERQLELERDAVVKQQQELFQVRATLDKRKEILDTEIKEWAVTSQVREEKLVEQEKVIAHKKTELDDLWEREKQVKETLTQVEEERMLIEREKKIDRERKQQLDSREEGIRFREEKMQRLLTS